MMSRAPFDALGVQLYTVRSLMSESVPDTLAAVAEIGYGEVELAGLFGHAPAEFRTMLDANGLRATSTHVGLGAIGRDALPETLATSRALGHDWVIVPSLPRNVMTPDGISGVAQILNRAGAAAAEHGIGVGFHNHAVEWAPMEGDGRTPMEVLLAETDAETVRFQMDVFWTVHAGVDPLEQLRADRGRYVSLHVKDRTPDGTMVPVGDGVIDYGTILPEAERLGVRHAFVEHDNPQEPHAAVESSYDHLRSVLG